jgi:tetratricopeptide (TPR) repeat protein
LVIILILPRSTLIDYFFSNNYRIILCEALGCFFLLGILSYGHAIKFFNVFLWRFPQYLGKISYSFFIVHFFILILFSSFLFNNLSEDVIQRFALLLELILSASSILTSIIIAKFLYKYIEYPFIQHFNIFLLPEQKWSMKHKALLLVLVFMVAIFTVGINLNNAVNKLETRSYLDRGKAYLNDGSNEKSIQLLQAALELKPDFAEAYINLGIIYKAKGRHENAIEYYKRGLALAPSMSDAHYNLGNIYILKGLVHEAEDHYLKAIALKPDNPDAYNNLGVTYNKMGLTEKAEKQFLIAERLRNKK